MKILAFAVLCVGVVLGYPTPGQEVPAECSDPTYACQDLESARRCDVVSSCIHDIWSSMRAPEDNDEICDICKEMVKEARDQLLSNMTQEEIKEVFEGSCKLLPIKLVADACIKVVDEIIPQLVEMLASRMDPNMVCTVSGLCNMAHLPGTCKLPKVIYTILKKEDQCAICTQLVDDAQAFIKSSTEDEVKGYVQNMCDSRLPRSICEIIMHEYFHDIYIYVKNSNDKEMCSSAGICPKTSENNVIAPVNDELTCEFCEHVLEHIKEQMTSNTTVAEFKQALLNFCKVTGKFSEKCTSFVNAYCDEIFDYLRKMDSKGMCTLIGLCSNNARIPLVKLIPAFETRRKVPLIRLQPAERVTNEIDPFQPLIELIPAELQNKNSKKVKVSITSSLKDSPFCDLCKEAMTEVEKQLNDPATEQQLENALGQICKILPKSLQDDCTGFIHQNVDAVFSILKQELRPDNICPALGLCPSSMRVVLPELKDLECDVCKDVVTSFRQKLQDPSTKVIVQTFLEEGCIRLPSSLAKECKDFVDQNIDTIITMLVQELDPATVCAILQICPKSVKVEKENDLECDLCKQVVEKVEDLVKDKKTEDEIQAALDKVCTYLPKSIAAKCEQFVNQYTDLLISLIADELDPGIVCSELKVCPASMKKLRDMECDLCKEAVQELDNLVKDPKTEDMIKQALEQVCSYLPSSMTPECTKYVDEYAMTLLHMLAEELDPAMVCAALKVCPAQLHSLFSTFQETNEIDFVEPPKTQEFKDMECQVCKDVIGQIEGLIKDRSSEDKIRDALDKVCSLLPSSFATKCQGIVNQYTEILITLLAQEIDPSMICAYLKVCPANVHLAEWLLKAQDFECQTCQDALHFVQEQLMSQDTQDEVKNVLKQVCSLLPQQFSQNCEAFVDEYGSQLLALVAQEIDPGKMCFQLKMCANQTTHFTHKHHSGIGRWHLDECSVCTTVVDYLDKLLEEDDVDKEITTLVAKVCDIVPHSFRGKCTTMLEAYGPYLLQMIGQIADSKQLCQEIDMCPVPKNHVHLIGGSKCTFGPSYWCRSEAHAAACNANEFCKNKRW